MSKSILCFSFVESSVGLLILTGVPHPWWVRGQSGWSWFCSSARRKQLPVLRLGSWWWCMKPTLTWIIIQVCATYRHFHKDTLSNFVTPFLLHHWHHCVNVWLIWLQQTDHSDGIVLELLLKLLYPRGPTKGCVFLTLWLPSSHQYYYACVRLCPTKKHCCHLDPTLLTTALLTDPRCPGGNSLRHYSLPWQHMLGHVTCTCVNMLSANFYT